MIQIIKAKGNIFRYLIDQLLFFRVKNFAHIYKRDKIDTIPGKISLMADKFIEKNEKKKAKKLLEDIANNEKNGTGIIKEEKILEDNDITMISKFDSARNMEKLIKRIDSEDSFIGGMGMERGGIGMERSEMKKQSHATVNDFDKRMIDNVEMDEKELDLDGMDVRKHFVGNVNDWVNKFKAKIN